MAHLRHGLGPFEGGLEEKRQSCDGSVQVTARDPLFDQVQLILSQVLGTGRIRRPLNAPISSNRATLYRSASGLVQRPQSDIPRVPVKVKKQQKRTFTLIQIAP